MFPEVTGITCSGGMHMFGWHQLPIFICMEDPLKPKSPLSEPLSIICNIEQPLTCTYNVSLLCNSSGLLYYQMCSTSESSNPYYLKHIKDNSEQTEKETRAPSHIFPTPLLSLHSGKTLCSTCLTATELHCMTYWLSLSE